MKSLIFVVLFFLLSPAFAATNAVEHVASDGLLAAYTLGGTGDYVGYNVIEIHRTCKVFWEAPDATTGMENLGNWCDSEDPHVPNVTDDPLIMQLEAIRIASNVTVGAALSKSNELLGFLVAWYELALYPQSLLVNATANTNGLTDNQKKIALGYWMHGYGVPYTEAAAVATAFVDSGTKAKYNELGLTAPPNPAKVILRELGEVSGEYF